MKTREEMIQELIEDDMNGVASMSMGENDDLIRDMLLEGRKGYNNYTNEELQEEYKRYLKMQNEEDNDAPSLIDVRLRDLQPRV